MGLFSACWVVVLLNLFGLLPLAGGLELTLYGLYGFAAAAGWVAGNVWVQRRRRLGWPRARHLLVVYLFGPPSLVYLLRALAPAEQIAAAPLVPLWGFFVYGIFFAVPVSLAPEAWRR